MAGCTIRALFVALLLLPTLSFGTNGLFDFGYGSINKAMAGAGVALPEDSLAAINNPAALAFVGTRLDLGASLFVPLRGYSATTPSGTSLFAVPVGSFSSKDNVFIIPTIGFSRQLPDHKSALGIALYGSGLNTNYTSSAPASLFGNNMPGVYGDGQTGMSLQQLITDLTYSRKLNNYLAGGVSLLLAGQALSLDGFKNFGGFTASGTTKNLTNNSDNYSFGVGAKLGLLAQIIPHRLTLGLSYQPKIAMSKFDKYTDALPQNGRLDIPGTGTVGLAWNVTPNNVLAFDVQEIWHDGVPAMSNSMQNMTNQCLSGNKSYCLGGGNGPGFGWKNMTIYKLGWQWASSPVWTWRLGYSHANQIIPSTEMLFNILAPAVIQDHITAGFTRKLSGNNYLSFNAMYAPFNSVTGPNPFAPGQNISVKMRQYEVGLMWSKLF